MNWWQIILVVSACSGWTITAMFFGAVITNTVHSQREDKRALKQARELSALMEGISAEVTP